MPRKSKRGTALSTPAATDSAAPPAALPLFYKQPSPLVAERDAELTLAASGDHRFAAITNSVPLVASELPQACKHFPILFSEGAAPQMVALLGLRTGENLFVDSAGRWSEGAYIPAYVRRYPFIFLESDDSSEYTLCIDLAAPGVGTGSGSRLFENGEPTDFTRTALDFCREYQAHFRFTADFIAALQEADLLVENRADVTLSDGERLSLSGFQVIDEERFNALPDETFLQWRRRGWLHLVYCHFISVGNWGALVDRSVLKAV